MQTALMVVLGVVSLVVIVVVMLQQDNGDGASALGGASTAVAKKAKGYEALLNKITVVGAAIFVVITIVLLILQ